MAKKSWREKLEKIHPSHGKIVDIPPKMAKRLGIGKMLIPKPLDIDTLIRTVPEGKLITEEEIRKILAKNANADTCCPITTGIFLRIVAETAEEDLTKGIKEITPYWRVIKKDGSLNPKFPGGVEKQAQKLKSEGHTIIIGKNKKTPTVKDFENYLIKFY